MTAPPRRRALIGLGSNVEPARHLRAALAEMDRAFDNLRRSPVCVSAAAGYDGPDYWNLCVGIDTELRAGELVKWLKELERSLGRNPHEPRFSPKTLDADLLLLGNEISTDPVLPHPEILTRPYVLGPLAMLEPERMIPGTGVRVRDLWRDFGHRDALAVLEADPL